MSTVQKIATHPPVGAAASAGAILAAASTVRPLPRVLWVAWAGLVAVAVRQATRG